MKILLIADEESKYLWDYYKPEKLADIDLILSCGDLNPRYLTFLATCSHAKVLYVHGNHDDRYDITPPEGCECIDDTIYEYGGVRILGLGGSMRYNPHGNYQFTERQMRARVRRLWWKLRRKRGFDILLTHAPACGLNDATDLPHRGFQVFNDLMERYHPRYFVHGHMHMNYGQKIPRRDHYVHTEVINAYERFVLEYEP